jgi:hypothetical protein
MLKRHAFSFGLQDNPPEGARTISGKAPPQPKKGLVSDRIFGEYQRCHTLDIPRPCRDTGPPSLAGFVFLGLNVSEFSANQSAVRRESASCRFASTTIAHRLAGGPIRMKTSPLDDDFTDYPLTYDIGVAYVPQGKAIPLA